MFVISLASSAGLGNLRKFKSLASKSCTSESLAYFFITMESWTQNGTVHTPVEVFTGSRDNKHNSYTIVEMDVIGSGWLYLGLFRDTGQIRKGRKNSTKEFIANFRVGPHGLQREEAIARLKAKAE